MRDKGAALIGSVVITVVVIAGLIAYDGYLVESSPVGSYYHYSYRANINALNTTEYTLILPMIVYQNGTPMKALVPSRVFGDGDFSEIPTRYGPALELHGRGNVTLAADGTYDAMRLSKDFKSDGTPAFSMWDRPSDWPGGPERKGDNGTIRLFSDSENITVTVGFDACSKWWHVREGVFKSGYERGGRGYSLSVIGMSRPLVLDEGWGNYSVRCGTIAVE